MADFLVLEEDGTSHLELEESADDFELEESGFVPPDPPPPTYATWKVGTVTVPSSTGSMAVTGLGGTPAAVFFFGTNWTTEDASVTTRGCALFRGMCAPQWDDPGTLVQNCAAVGPAGDQHMIQPYSIIVPDTAGSASTLYLAEVASFDAGGFTLDWLAGASGGYKVVWVALMDVANVGGYLGPSSSLDLGWKAGASLLHGAWNGPTAAGNSSTQEFYGGGAYPGTGGGSTWFGAGLTDYTFPAAFGGQYLLQIYNSAPSSVIAQDASFSGPSMAAQNVTAYPTGGSHTFFDFSTNLADTEGMVVMWDDEDSETGRLTPDATSAGTVTVSGLPFPPGLVIGYSVGSEPQGQGLGARGAAGLSVITPGFQWSALVLDHAVGYPSAYGYTEYVGAYQSFQRGVIDSVENSDVHTATVELTDDGFIVTTEEDDIDPQQWVWHAFGHPESVVWIPQIYRRQT